MVLYCDTEWDEHEIYEKRFKQIIKRSEISELQIETDQDVIREFKRRVDKKLRGTEPLDKSLLFYRILNFLKSKHESRENILSELEIYSEHCVDDNLSFLEQSGYIELDGKLYKLSPNTRKLLTK